MKILTQEEVVQRDNIHIFTYTLNVTALKMLDFGALFLLMMAACVYPFTHFDPVGWMIAPVILGVGAVISLIVAQYWRKYAQKAFLAYDDEYFFVGSGADKVSCVPWDKLDIHNSGLAAPGKGANFVINIDGDKVPVRLFSTVVCIPQFETVLRTILKHIQANEKEADKDKAYY